MFKRHTQTDKITKHDRESMQASEAALDEYKLDDRCAQLGRHIANCDCRGEARKPLTPEPS